MTAHGPLESQPDTTAPSKSRAAILLHYITGGKGGEFDTYRDPDLYDRGAHSAAYKRDNLSRGVADITEEHLPHGGDTRILDIGAGTGILSLELARRDHFVTALDLFPEPLARLEEKATKNNLEGNLTTVQADMNDSLPFEDDSFGSVVSLRATRYIHDFDGWLGEVKRVLEPGGSFILPVFAVDTIPWKRHSKQGVLQPTSAKRVMQAILNAGLEINETSGASYIKAVDLESGQRDVPFYYRPTFAIANNPSQQQ